MYKGEFFGVPVKLTNKEYDTLINLFDPDAVEIEDEEMSKEYTYPIRLLTTPAEVCRRRDHCCAEEDCPFNPFLVSGRSNEGTGCKDLLKKILGGKDYFILDQLNEDWFDFNYGTQLRTAKRITQKVRSFLEKNLKKV